MGVIQGHRQYRHSTEHMRLSNRLNRNYTYFFYHFRVIASYLSKVANFNLPHLHLVPTLGTTPLDFTEIFGVKKLESLRYSVEFFA